MPVSSRQLVIMQVDPCPALRSHFALAYLLGVIFNYDSAILPELPERDSQCRLLSNAKTSDCALRTTDQVGFSNPSLNHLRVVRQCRT